MGSTIMMKTITIGRSFSPALYCEEFKISKGGELSGDFCLYTFEHEDITEHSIRIQGEHVIGKGKATILGEQCEFEIIEAEKLIKP